MTSPGVLRGPASSPDTNPPEINAGMCLPPTDLWSGGPFSCGARVLRVHTADMAGSAAYALVESVEILRFLLVSWCLRGVHVRCVDTGRRSSADSAGNSRWRQRRRLSRGLNAPSGARCFLASTRCRSSPLVRVLMLLLVLGAFWLGIAVSSDARRVLMHLLVRGAFWLYQDGH